MKQLMKSISLISVFLITASTSFAQWETLRYINDSFPLPWIYSISFTDVDSGLGACAGMVSYQPGGPSSHAGAIIKTTDGGITWNNAFIVDSTVFRKIVNVNHSTAYCVGEKWLSNKGIIARTTNYGLTWDSIITPYPLYSVSFPSYNTGYVCGANVIMKTTNAGNNWQLLNSGFTQNFLNCIFLNDTVGFITGDTLILKTIDGGLNWNAQNFGTGLEYEYIVDISFPTFNTGYFILYGDSCFIYKTTNNGNQWSRISTVTDTWGLYLSSIDFPNDLTGYITGQFQMHKTIDGGLTWHRQHAGPPAMPDFMDDLMDIFFLNTDTGFAAGSSQFYRTFNGGDSIYSGVNSINADSKKICVYPNPFKNSTIFKLGQHKEVYSLLVYNLNGQVVRKLDNISSEQLVFDRQNIQPGFFFYQLTSETKIIASGKIIIE